MVLSHYLGAHIAFCIKPNMSTATKNVLKKSTKKLQNNLHIETRLPSKGEDC